MSAPLIKPRLIHPVIIVVSPLDEEVTKNRIDEDFKTFQRGKAPKWKTEESDLLRFKVQKKINKMGFWDKKKGGYARQTVLTFVGYAKDFVTSDGYYKLNAGDKVIRMEDMRGNVKQEMEAYVKSIILKGEYDKFNFIDLLCERKMVTV